ncbi:MAG: NifB/NifX family molybdenum-iron cluster-binding protein [Bacillota bacterium]
MKIAVSTDAGNVAAHFGHCPKFTLVEVEEGRIKNQVEVTNPAHQPCSLPRYLQEMGVTHILTGGMGEKAKEAFQRIGITAITGVKGAVADAVTDYIAGKLVGGPSLCKHGTGGHTHHHRCGSGGCGGRH